MSGYSVAGALGGFGYDEYSSPGFYEEDNYTKRPIKQKPRTFRERVEAKKQEMNKNVVKMSRKPVEEDPCECRECAPHLYRNHSQTYEKDKSSNGSGCGCGCDGKKYGLFSQMTQQDCFIIFIIIIISIVLYCMYCTMCRLNQLVSNMPNSGLQGLNRPNQ